jgi:hypothetical protein
MHHASALEYSKEGRVEAVEDRCGPFILAFLVKNPRK